MFEPPPQKKINKITTPTPQQNQIKKQKNKRKIIKRFTKVKKKQKTIPPLKKLFDIFAYIFAINNFQLKVAFSQS